MDSMRIWWLLLVHLSTFSSDVATAISLTTVGRPCAGEPITFTCTVPGVELQWDPSDVISSQSILITTQTSSSITEGLYTAVLDSSNTTTVTSILTTTARDGVTIECGPLGSILRESLTIIVADLPSTLLNPRFVLTINGTETSMVTIQWDPPQISGAVDNYTVSITPEPVSGDSISTLTGTQIDFVLNYNVPYSVEVVASNCAGTSESPSSFNFTLVRCDDPTVPLNGQLGSTTNRTEGSFVTFTCDEGFLPTGLISAECMTDMTWNPDPGSFVCVPIPTDPPILCGLPQSPVNGSLGGHLPSSSLGATVTFQCDDGLFPTDMRTATCRDMSGRGEWEPNPAQLLCSECTCIDQGNQCPSAITGVGVAISVVVTFIVSVLIGLTVGVLGTYLFMRDKVRIQNGSPSTASTNPPPPGPVYEEVSTPKENIELETNLAYGPVRR